MLKEITIPSRTAPGSKPMGAPAGSPAKNETKIRVLLADDHNIVREGLRLLIESTSDIEVVAEVENGRQAVEQAIALNPDVVVLDLAMPNLNGLEATRQILKELPKMRILILSSYSDDERVQQLIEEGATGYLVKQSAAKDLLNGIRETKKGNTFFSPSISKQLMDRMRQTLSGGVPQPRKANKLTTREAEVLQLIAEGHPNKGIADQLGISVKTVEKHRQQVMNKLNIHGIAGLTRHAVAKGFTMPVGESGPG